MEAVQVSPQFHYAERFSRSIKIKRSPKKLIKTFKDNDLADIKGCTSEEVFDLSIGCSLLSSSVVNKLNCSVHLKEENVQDSSSKDDVNNEVRDLDLECDLFKVKNSVVSNVEPFNSLSPSISNRLSEDDENSLVETEQEKSPTITNEKTKPCNKTNVTILESNNTEEVVESIFTIIKELPTNYTNPSNENMAMSNESRVVQKVRKKKSKYCPYCYIRLLNKSAIQHITNCKPLT